MRSLFLPLFDFSNGAFIMTIVLLFINGTLVGAVFFLMNTDKKKGKNNKPK